MNKMRSVFSMLLVVALVGCQREASDSASNRTEALEPPSFEFFEAGNMWAVAAPKNPLMIIEPRVLAKLSNQPTGTSDDTLLKRDPRYFYLPLVLFRCRHVFKDAPLSQEETDLAVELATSLAEAFQKPEFRIQQVTDDAITESLWKIKEWFEQLCNDNQTLGQMIITNDDGPYVGENVEGSQLDSTTESATIELIAKKGSAVLLIDRANNQLIIQHRNPENKVLWSRRIMADSGASVGTPAGFSETPLEYYEGFGYKLNLYATSTYGTESMTVYLAADGSLRFYFLGW